MDYAGRMGINTGKGAIFDLDGTLLDSMGVWDQVDIDFLGRRGIEVPDDYMTKVSAMQFRQIAEYTIARFGLEDTPEQLMAEWDEMARVAYSTVVEAKPHAVEYLHLLRTSGAKLAVATSLPPALRDPAMAHVGIGGLFDEVVSVDDAGDVSKESPDVYLLAARTPRRRAGRLHGVRGSAGGDQGRQVGGHDGLGHERRFLRRRLGRDLRGVRRRALRLLRRPRDPVVSAATPTVMV